MIRCAECVLHWITDVSWQKNVEWRFRGDFPSGADYLFFSSRAHFKVEGHDGNDSRCDSSTRRGE
jgi:hypothetical protein